MTGKKFRHIVMSHGMHMLNFRELYSSVTPGRAKYQKNHVFRHVTGSTQRTQKLMTDLESAIWFNYAGTFFCWNMMKSKEFRNFWIILNFQSHLAAKLCKISNFVCWPKSLAMSQGIHIQILREKSWSVVPGSGKNVFPAFLT